MHSGVAGSLSPFDTARHLQDRIQTSYLEMDTLDALVTPPLNKVSHINVVYPNAANFIFSSTFWFVNGY